MHHNLPYSLTRLIPVNSSSLLTLGLMITLLLIGCGSQKTTPSAQREQLADTGSDQSQPVAAESRTIQQLTTLTDTILVALVRGDYQRIETLLAPGDQPITGLEAAAILLKTRGEPVVLDGWDAGAIQVTLTDSLSAQTNVPVSYRRAPNRPSRNTTFVLRFVRLSADAPWRLTVR